MDSFKSKLSRLANWLILLPKKILGWHKPEVAPAKEEKTHHVNRSRSGFCGNWRAESGNFGESGFHSSTFFSFEISITSASSASLQFLLDSSSNPVGDGWLKRNF